MLTSTLCARFRRTACLTALTMLGVVGCTIPQDPRDTLERARGGTLRVGAVDSPPWIVRTDGDAAGPEAELVRAFARSIDADVDWRWGSLDASLRALEEYELDVVAGGLTARSPWRAHVAFTRPWREEGGTKHVLALPPGENGALVALDRLIESRRTTDR